jgi:predicted RNA binding protein YcfA (HicA-like mRNA interferase family)
MSRLRPVKAHRLQRALERLGYRLVRTVGSHRVFLDAATGRRTTVPFHGGGEDVPRGTVKAILEDIGLTWDELERLL